MVKNIYSFFYFILCYCLSACSNESHAIIKSIKINSDLNVEWYHSPGFINDGPDVVEIKGSKKNQIICKAQNICDIKFASDTLLILSEGYIFKSLNLKNEYGIKIKIDTTCSSPYLYRDTHKN
jgi:hypothetical protein